MIVTLEDMKLYLRSEQSLDEKVLIAALASAHTSFYNLCGRTFEAAAVSATARSYVPSCLSVLRIHDCVAITSITSNGTTVTGYQKEPVGPTWSGETRPYEQVRLLNSWWYQNGSPGEASVTVTARWGWAATPAPAVDAVKVLCKDIVGNRDVRAGFVSFGDAGVAAARRNPYILGVVGDYGRHEGVIGVAG